MRIDAALLPHCDVDVTAAGWVALTDLPWLALTFAGGVPRGRWIRIAYRASYLDHLVRPLITFETPGGSEWDTMQAPLFGRTSWIGRVPDQTRRVLICPVDRPGAFGFEIESVETVSRLILLPRAFRRDRKTAAMAIGARLINARQETRQALMFARGGVGMEDYGRWRTERHRRFEPTGLDAPRRPPDRLPHVRFVVWEGGGPLTRETPLLASLLASCFANWSLRLPPSADVADLACAGFGSRMVLGLSGTDAPDADLRDSDLLACLDPSVSLPDYALSVVAEAAAREVDAECFYGDEDRRRSDGFSASPLLKPDWSPQLEGGQSYLGAPVFWRVGKVRRMQSLTTDGFEAADWRLRALEQATPKQVHHIRRMLATSPEQPPASPCLDRGTAPSPVPSAAASIIIPTKNQLPLLRECLNGLLFETTHPVLEILIIDNGSDSSVHAFYATLAGDPRIRIMNMPGRFNFSAMCNAGAASARGQCLLFLNNDMSVVTPGWLGPLVAEAMRPGIGAVGARLLFPDGSIQHAGVAVGMGGYADHVSHGQAGDYAGYLGRLGVAHEVGAVTGACIAVEAGKFNAVNGFDAERFPVELSDIDLCLRLAAAGWKSLMRPDSVLIHHQSATRGFSFRPFDRYGLERGHFRTRWRDMIRDDPFFHPALSLFSTEPALDG